MKILLVDDKEENLYMLETLLTSYGYKVVSAENGAIAFDLLKKEKIDLIISDILMPVMDGFTLCRKCKGDNKLSSIPFIFYTATYTDKKDEEFALNLGADKFLLKPQDPDVFIEIVKSIFEEMEEDKISPPKLTQIADETILKEYNASLIRKLEDKMQDAEENERKLKQNVIELENTIEKLLKVERELKESEERYRLILENSIDAILLTSPDGTILSANKAACEMFQMTEKEIMQRGRNGIVDLSDPRLPVLLKQREETGKAKGELTFLRKDKTPIQTELSTSVFFTKDGEKRTSMIIRDITKRKKAQEQISLLAHAIKSISECVSITDVDDKLIFVNDAFLQTYGYKEKEIIGKHISIIRPNIPEMKRGIKDILPSTIKGGWQGELINVRKDGSQFPIYLSTSVVKNDNGEPIALIGVAKDITNEKKSREELIRAKDEAERSNKLKTEFLAQMSHEIRSPLNAILNFSSVIKEEVDCKDSEILEVAFSAIDSASKRIIRTVDAILNMSELQIGTYKTSIENVDLFPLMKNLVSEFKSMAENKWLKLNFNCNVDKAVISTDDYAVRQIFANLIDNAIKYTKEGGVEVKLSQQNDKSYLVSIIDSGIGISKEFLPRLYDAFSQEEQGYSRSFEGSGLGLALTARYCRLIDAEINVESKKNKGTTFTVLLKDLK